MNRTKRPDLRLVLVVLLASAFALVLPSCTSQTNNQPTVSQKTEPQIVNITPEQAFQLIQQHKGDKNFVILDVRTPSEFQQGHIEHALNLNLYDPDFKAKLAQLDTAKTYLVYCRSGHRSALAAQQMKSLNFRHVYNMKGGISSWIAKGYPVVTSSGE